MRITAKILFLHLFLAAALSTPAIQGVLAQPGPGADTLSPHRRLARDIQTIDRDQHDNEYREHKGI